MDQPSDSTTESPDDTTDVHIVVRNDLDKNLSSRIKVMPLSLPGRLKLAAKSLAICWGITIFCVFIPVLHFFLVPGGLFLGLFLFYRQFGFHEFLVEGIITCPMCSGEIRLGPGAFDWPKRERCSNCGAELIIGKQNELSDRHSGSSEIESKK